MTDSLLQEALLKAVLASKWVCKQAKCYLITCIHWAILRLGGNPGHKISIFPTDATKRMGLFQRNQTRDDRGLVCGSGRSNKK